ncbi:unnamed protein product [Boreogadus saida]
MMYSPITARIIFHGDFTTGDWELNPSAQLATLNLNNFSGVVTNLLRPERLDIVPAARSIGWEADWSSKWRPHWTGNARQLLERCGDRAEQGKLFILGMKSLPLGLES